MKQTETKKGNKMIIITIILSVIFLLVAGIAIFINQPSFGRLPRGERMERIKQSPNYRDGKFQNQHETPQLTSDKSYPEQIAGFLFKKVDRLRPVSEIPVVKTNLWQLDPDEDVLIWLGHGAYFIQTDNKRILVDPTLRTASPLSFYNKAFKGTEAYSPQDIPAIDYLVISHDHWDHLDYYTVKEIKDRTRYVICPLGVGEHFEYWGFDKKRILEMDWQESVQPDNGFEFHCLPARHFSGRGLKPNQTLWASFLLQTPGQRIFLGGDGGYDTHFAEIAERFAPVNLAILENGQYDAGWKYIHLLPGDLVKAIRDLHPEKVLTVHHSKYALGKHAWDEPLNRVAEAAVTAGFNLLTPRIGEPVYFKEKAALSVAWWKGIE